MLEVLAGQGLAVYREPAQGSLRLGSRSFGEFVLAERQSYHGWLRLADGEGWIHAFEGPGDGQGQRLVVCIHPDELQLARTPESALLPAHTGGIVDSDEQASP